MAGIYDKYLLPGITHTLCASNPNMKQRNKIVPFAKGRVLEVGVGTGLNFSFYDPEKVEYLLALDPSEAMWSIAEQHVSKLKFNVEFVKAFAEHIPIEKNSIDSIVITYTLCSIPRFEFAFQEFRRVLKPNGILLFCEHGIAPDPAVRKWQNLLNPIWKTLGGGCNLNRDIPSMIQNGGFYFERMETMYIPGFKPACYNFWGVAKSS